MTGGLSFKSWFFRNKDLLPKHISGFRLAAAFGVLAGITTYGDFSAPRIYRLNS
jgi:hypothetical protein